MTKRKATPSSGSKREQEHVAMLKSDIDFTRLVQRLREDGLGVYGFGERTTPEAFRSACNRFIYVENLAEAGAEKGDKSGASTASAAKKEPPSKAVKIIAKAIEDADGWENLSDVGSRIHGAASDFDACTYGCPNLSSLIDKSGSFEIRKDKGAVYNRRTTAGVANGKRS